MARRNVNVVSLLLLMLLTSGCSRFFTGGGWLYSAVEGKKVIFGFQYRASEDDPTIGDMHGVYRDSGQNVYFRFAGTQSITVFGDPDYFGVGYDYASLDPKNPGTGRVVVWGGDLGEPGVSAGDEFNVEVLSGPYTGYSWGGLLEGGNMQDHD